MTKNSATLIGVHMCMCIQARLKSIYSNWPSFPHMEDKLLGADDVQGYFQF